MRRNQDVLLQYAPLTSLCVLRTDLSQPSNSGTESEAAAYEFTTLTTVPGSLKMNGAAIQILDLREFLAVTRV